MLRLTTLLGGMERMDMVSRIWQVFVGAVLVSAGTLMLYAFQFLARRGHDTWFDIAGTALVIEAYSIVASLFVLLGLRYLFGYAAHLAGCCQAGIARCGRFSTARSRIIRAGIFDPQF